MDRLQVREVEVPIDRVRCQLGHSGSSDRAFYLGENLRVSVAEPVSEYLRTRVVVSIGHSPCRRRIAACASSIASSPVRSPGEYRSSSCFGFGSEGGDSAHFETGPDACYFPFNLARGQDAGGFTRNLVSFRHGLLPLVLVVRLYAFLRFRCRRPSIGATGGVLVVLR